MYQNMKNMSQQFTGTFRSSLPHHISQLKVKAYKLILIVAAMYPVHAIYDITPRKKEDILSKLSWVEEADINGPINQDIFFDRVVFVTIDSDQPITPGVFFTERHVLTSFNPFRKQYRRPLANVRILFLSGRILTAAEDKNLHQINKSDVICARQVVPTSELRMRNTQWHGTDKTHSPLHDLLVLRIKDEIKFLDPDPSKYSFSKYSIGNNDSSFTPAGPMVTPLAGPYDTLGRNLRFASLGFRSKEHIAMNRELRSTEYEEDQNVIDECEEWFPKDWGNFICISNVDNYKGVGSGSLLVHNNTVFGIGSFLLKKGDKSILVFTDVRPYSHIIFRICGQLNSTDI